MKPLRSLASAAALCFLLTLPCLAQSVGPISITASQCASIGVSPNTAVVAIQVAGTWTGTLQPQGTVQGQSAFNVLVTPSTSQTAQATITANGAFSVLVAGYSTLQVCGATVASGTATVYLNSSQAPAGGGAGAPASGLPIAGSPIALPATVTSLNVFGDSIAGGYGLQYRLTQSFGSMLGNALGAPVANNYGSPGAKINTFVSEAYAVTPSAPVASITIMGSNDVTSTPVAEYTSSAQAYAVWLGSQPAQIKQTTGMTLVGTWQSAVFNNITTRYSQVLGDTATATVSGTAIYASILYQTLPSSFTIAVDGTICYTAASEVKSGSIAQLIRCGGLSSGAHTVVLTQTKNGDYLAVQWVGGNGGSSGALPFQIVGNTLPRISQNASTFNAALAIAIAQLQSDGFNILYVDESSLLNLSASPPQYVDGVHPNVLGNQLITQNFLNSIYASNAVANLNAQAVAAALQVIKNLPGFPGGSISATGGTVPSSLTDYGNPGEFMQGNTDSFGLPYQYVSYGTQNWASLPLMPFNSNVAAVLATSDLTAQGAAIAATTIFAVTQSAMYRVCYSAAITRASDTSSTLGGTNGFQLVFTSPTDSVAKTTVAGNGVTSTANTTGTAIGQCIVSYAKAATNLQFSFGYTDSHTVTSMQYELHVRVEQI